MSVTSAEALVFREAHFAYNNKCYLALSFTITSQVNQNPQSCFSTSVNKTFIHYYYGTKSHQILMHYFKVSIQWLVCDSYCLMWSQLTPYWVSAYSNRTLGEALSDMVHKSPNLVWPRGAPLLAQSHRVPPSQAAGGRLKYWKDRRFVVVSIWSVSQLFQGIRV